MVDVSKWYHNSIKHISLPSRLQVAMTTRKKYKQHQENQTMNTHLVFVLCMQMCKKVHADTNIVLKFRLKTKSWEWQ